MMLTRISKCLVAATCILALSASSASANLLANPDFENPSTAPNVEYFGAPGWTDFGGGTFTINNVVEPNQLAGSTQVLKLFGGTSGVFQDFPASPGQIWNGGAFILNSSGDLMTGGQVAAVNIEWKGAGGSDLGFISNGLSDANQTPDMWIQRTVTGMAPAGTETARLTLITGNFAGDPFGGAPRYDNAFFEVVPEPASLGVLSMGLLGLLSLRRRR